MRDFLDIKGLHLEYRTFGNRDSHLPTVVLLHEGLGCIDMWKDFPEKLAEETGHPVFTFSRQGYGRSSAKQAPWPLEYMRHEGLEILPEVLDAAGLKHFILVGHSDGASIALIYSGGIALSKASALVLMAPHVFNESVCVENIALAKTAYETTTLRSKLERYHGDNVDNAFWGWNTAWLDPKFMDWNIEEYLPAIDVPILLIQGEGDQYATHAQLDAIQNQVDGIVTTKILPECKHSPHFDQPEQVLANIAAFLRDL